MQWWVWALLGGVGAVLVWLVYCGWVEWRATMRALASAAERQAPFKIEPTHPVRWYDGQEAAPPRDDGTASRDQ